jgi:hypothetical protein
MFETSPSGTHYTQIRLSRYRNNRKPNYTLPFGHRNVKVAVISEVPKTCNVRNYRMDNFKLCQLRMLLIINIILLLVQLVCRDEMGKVAPLLSDVPPSKPQN